MIWKRTRDVFWAISPNVLEEVLEQAKLENKGLGEISGLVKQRTQNLPSSFEGRVAIVPIKGPLQKSENVFSQLFGISNYDSLGASISTFVRDPSIDTIILDIDSPGGEVNGCSELAQLVAEGTKYKPIIAYGSGDIASGAYWIASAATKIVASETSSVGSIGVVGIYNKGDEGQLEIVSSQSPLKRIDPSTKEGRQKLQERIDDIADVFISSVAKNRGTTKEDVIENFGNGDVLIGQKARKAGLVDEIGTLSSTISKFFNKKEIKMENNKENVAVETQSFEEGLISGRFAEKDRIISILQMGFEENVSRDFLKTAVEMDLDIEAVKKLLPSAPKEAATKTAFESVMASVENPKIESQPLETEQDFDKIAKKIAKINK